ncbi:MAG TPA: PAS domain S-box protein [Bryobacteraceae bacterium]|jgi:PAS domain S-box-containing protein|nr:PAS domain S-box protein [Bryobacteraceae bacterium]
MSDQSNHRGRILIVEDQGIVATDIRICLEDAGFEVTGIAISMNEAIREASTTRPDLVLMDIRIQGEADGIDAGDYLHRSFGVPIVYLTAHDDQDTIVRAKRTEPMAFLVKPFKPAELTSTVEIAVSRSRAEKEVCERERFFLSAMDAIGDAVLTTDSGGRVRFINRAAEELTGWRQETALGCNATDVVHMVDSVDGFRELLNFNHAPEFQRPGEYQIVSRDGEYHWVSIKATVIAGADDTSVRVIVMQDITNRKQREQALRRQADLLDQSQDAIFTWDVDGAISYWSRGAQALYGFDLAEALGRAVGELLASHSPGVEEWEIALKRDGRWSGELTRKTKIGRQLIVESLLVVVHNGSSGGIVLETDRDITERKRAELEIERLNQELQARIRDLTSVNRELESFNYSIAHDLRAPLRHINAYTKIVLDQADISLPAEARNHLEHARQGAQRMGCMVDALLELSRTSRRELTRRTTGVKSLVDDVLAELKPEFEGRQIEWRIGELPFLDCDPTLIRQVLANLISNAVKFTRSRTPAVIEVGQSSHKGQRVLFVRDNGVGFSMKYADKLFGVFQRLHRREDFEGTGVGLATVQRIIHKHGGRIWVTAELDKGATFYFTLDSPGEPRPEPEREETAALAGVK